MAIMKRIEASLLDHDVFLGLVFVWMDPCGV